MTSRSLLGIAGTESGSGKTLVTMGFIRALQRNGRTVQPFKVGPDFIDPLYHECVADRASVNLDRFFMESATVEKTLDNYLEGADVGVVEGVMGLFDGKSGEPGRFSTAELFREFQVPYVLVVNAAGQSHSVAAKIKGFIEYEEDLDCVGVVLTRVASDRHRTMLKRSIKENLDVPVLGSLPDRESLEFPSRHLGLDTAFLSDHSSQVRESVDETITTNLTLPEVVTDSDGVSGQSLPSVFESDEAADVTIGVARDDAFHFYYDYNLRQLRRAGAELVDVSPLRDSTLPDRLNGLYIGGGYPEQFAGELSANASFVRDLRKRLVSGLVTLAECGGFMYLARTLTDRTDETHDMVGWFDVDVNQTSSFRALGYRSATVTSDHPFLDDGDTVKGHEFHYSECSLNKDVELAIQLDDADGLNSGRAGYVKKNTVGSYVHWHFGSAPGMARKFVNRCAERRKHHA